METIEYLTLRIREVYSGTPIIISGFDDKTAAEALANNEADAIVFGTPFIANPDLVERYREEDALNAAAANNFCTPGESGHTDYPAMVA
jgi:N-ethylmaleimide reductase